MLHLGSSTESDYLVSIADHGEGGVRIEGEEGGRRRLTTLTKKNLPFGFGPAGARFVVEEVGEVSVTFSKFPEF